MFVLSIVPVPLSAGLGGIPLEDKPDLTVIENRIQSLEALLTAKIVQQDPGVNVSGFDNSLDVNNQKEIKAEIERLRKIDIELRKATGQDSNVDEVERLNEFKANEAKIDQRIKDLEGLKAYGVGYDADPNMEGVQSVSGVDNQNIDPVALDNGIKELKKYKAELNSLSDFWKTISDGHVGETKGAQNTKPSEETNNNENVNGDPFVDLSNLSEEQQTFYNQIKFNFNYVLGDANEEDITASGYSSSFASRMFVYLKDLTDVPISKFRKQEMLKYIEKMADGSATDLNGDGEVSVDDVVRLWETVTPPPPPPEAEELAKLTETIKKLFDENNEEDLDVDPDELPDLLSNELKKFTGIGGSLSDRTNAIINFLEEGRTIDKTGDGEFTYEDLVEIWKNPNKIASLTDKIVQIINGDTNGNSFKLKKDLYKALESKTGMSNTLERRQAIKDILNKIAAGDMTADLNNDGYLDYGDVIKAWESVVDSEEE